MSRVEKKMRAKNANSEELHEATHREPPHRGLHSFPSGQGAPVAQWVKRWPAELAVPSSRPARCNRDFIAHSCYLKLMISESKFSGTRKFTSRYYEFGMTFDFEITRLDCNLLRYLKHVKKIKIKNLRI